MPGENANVVSANTTFFLAGLIYREEQIRKELAKALDEGTRWVEIQVYLRSHPGRGEGERVKN